MQEVAKHAVVAWAVAVGTAPRYERTPEVADAVSKAGGKRLKDDGLVAVELAVEYGELAVVVDADNVAVVGLVVAVAVVVE